ncbi:OPN4 [Lepeophtheirus salmonis]|uniref:OPN4 n=1 Tax=Lepeophtheirus salmonis TaxID=72036 RepID=A0A7R8CDG1_LEPSM|nr:OPN4 [Lepeophtheirus salmonis]CAF2779145.1 OPN4 [Lepeophtheirus salmonis]
MSALKGLSSPSAGLYMDDVYYNQYPPGMKMTDGIPEELREVIHSHWDQFSPANPLIAHFFGVMFFFLWVMNFVGNGLVIFIFSKVKSLRTPSNMFVINLALSDLLMMTTMGPAVTVNVFMQRYWAWGVFGCKLYGCVGAICGVVSILTMVVIGYDRYNVIVKGLNGFRISVGKALAIILVIWAYSIAISALALFDIWGEDTRSIVKAVWAHEMALKQQAKKMNVESLRTNVDSNAESAEIRIAKVAVTNVSLWAGIWTPYTLVVLMAVMGSRSSITPLVSQLPSFIAKTASCLNPMVYAMSHPKYREALMKEVPCLGIEEESMEEAVTTKEPVKA